MGKAQGSRQDTQVHLMWGSGTQKDRKNTCDKSEEKHHDKNSANCAKALGNVYFQRWGQFCPLRHVAMPGDIFGRYSWGGQGAAKCPTMHRTASQQRITWHNVNSAPVEESHVREPREKQQLETRNNVPTF